MTWTATVESSRVGSEGQLDTMVVLSNDHGEKFRQRFFNDGSPDALRRVVLRWIAEFESRPAKLASLAPGTMIDCTPSARPPAPPDAALSPAEADRRAFLAAWRRYQALKAAEAAGLISPTNKELTDTIDEVRTRWDATYLDMLG